MSFNISQYMVFLAYQTLDERGPLRHDDELSIVKGAIMRPQTYSAATIANLIRRHTVVTLEQMQQALDDGARRTVFRKLEQLDYRSSYSHCGRYYTLTELARFDVHGLWEVDGVRFSAHGSLAATAEALVPASPGGLFAAEFDALTGVATSNVLDRLAGGGRRAARPGKARWALPVLCRRQGYEGPAASRAHRRDDRAATARSAAWQPPGGGGGAVFWSSQRAPAAPLRGARIGANGARRRSSRGTCPGARPGDRVARPSRASGRRDRQRPCPQAGRWSKAARKKTPAIFNRIRDLMDGDTAGDPGSALKWTRRTTAKLARQLRESGIRVGTRTVARLLRSMGYSLRVNHKKLAAANHPQRDAQFARITVLRRRGASENIPIISIDTKKKELIGRFKNAGAKWDRYPEQVLDHDFRSLASGVAVPYGIYDLRANTGTVFVGTSSDTPVFAADCVAAWWRDHGKLAYPDAGRMIIFADSGGSNGCRPRAWKAALQHKLCDQQRIEATVAHYPAGTSKWNPIEHRLGCNFRRAYWESRVGKELASVICFATTGFVSRFRRCVKNRGVFRLGGMLGRERSTQHVVYG